jgi:FlaA1/EpsC-like NDP-sugar epimerase
MPAGLRGVFLWLLGLQRRRRTALTVGLDLLICVAAVWVSYWLRLGDWEFVTAPVLLFAGIAAGAWIAVAFVTRTYRSVTRYADAHTLRGLVGACMLLSASLGVVLFGARIQGVPRTLSVIHPIIFLLGLVSARVAISRLVAGALTDGRGERAAKRILVYGAGFTAQQLAASMRRERSLQVVGFVDQNMSMRKSLLEGRPIWHTSDLEAILQSASVDEVVLAIPSMKRHSRREIVETIAKFSGQVKVRALPKLSEIASGRVSVNDIRDVQIEELLGRDEIAPDPVLMAKNIAGRAVLVTGAGGSIGSELCRQILQQRPALIVLADQSEYALYKIDAELRKLVSMRGLTVDLQAVLVNVANDSECAQLFQNYHVDTVFHAAAYKHVPLVESNPVAGIRNNVLGTLNTARASELSGVEKFILVSTDKAVRPTNVMGASKRVCELIVQARAAAQERTSFCSVRFGNVLGSSGSVVPAFREQIASGGPVTITASEATRYFMTIPEAAQLVIQAGALGAGGEVLLLDMGEPVRILDLARLMIELSGLTIASGPEVDGDIAIEETGLRPGEKLVEELLIGGDCQPTAHPRIIKSRENMVCWQDLEPTLVKLASFLRRSDADGAIRVLKEIVPEFQSATELDSPSSEKMIGTTRMEEGGELLARLRVQVG